ncbi:VOC family protein [Brucella anthropi]|uniref:VOC family protein n=1 Tax=Brucella TaxID=234 RepID=UPI00178C1836|nr:VOC family protein [Brucella anthropi]MBM6397294.1 hypothetical protein [Brucella anthropi]
MADDQFALYGRGTHMFAGLPVRNFGISLEWYRRFLGSSPNFCPNDTEAVWLIAEYRWIYIIVDPKRAGGAIQTVMCSDLEATIAEISKRGIDFSDEERPAEGVRKVIYYDPDGNEIGLGSIPPEEE